MRNLRTRMSKSLKGLEWRWCARRDDGAKLDSCSEVKCLEDHRDPKLR